VLIAGRSRGVGHENDEDGASTPDRDVRVFAGVRSDPFYLAWDVAALKTLPNLLQHSNVLCIVVEVDTRHVLDPARGWEPRYFALTIRL
jgi:hypothetical protein